ncbi:CerR family C-terminal domain-containing protein [Paludisphaera sp.]|uniref:TetR/AcrR family transcriptional regulator n=1 Tax=Paludisphaera sp. TaxID=2017432 RepID=UPI00301D2190
MSSPDATKDRLIEAAGREFAEKGYDSARIRTICERAGANLAAVNYHFGDKQGLYRTVLTEAYRRRSTTVTPDLGDLPPAEKLRRFIRFFVEQVVVGEDDGEWRLPLILRELFDPTPALDDVIDGWIRPRFELLGSILREIRPGVDERRLAALCFSVVGQCIVHRITMKVSGRLLGPGNPGCLDADYLSDHVADFTLAALGLGPPAGMGGPARE